MNGSYVSDGPNLYCLIVSQTWITHVCSTMILRGNI